MEPVLFRVLDPKAIVPKRANADDAGLDLASIESVRLPAQGGRAIVRTGLAVELPTGTAGLVVPRSGLAAKHGVTVTNAPGLIDEGYRGEIKVVLMNTDPSDEYLVCEGDRVAQLLVVEVVQRDVEVVSTLSDSQRGEGGFGHSGK